MVKEAEMKDAFGNELVEGDFVVYAVGQGHSAGGLRIGRVTAVTSLDKPVFTAFNVKQHTEFDNPNEKGYDYNGKEDPEGYYAEKGKPGDNYWNRKRRETHQVIDGWREDSARRIGGFNQVKKIINTSEIADPTLRAFMDSLNEAR